MSKNTLGQRIKSLREKKGLNQKELAEILKVNNSTLSQYENDVRVPSDDIKLVLANYFNVTTDYLLGRSDSIRPSNDYLTGVPAGAIVIGEASTSYKHSYKSTPLSTIPVLGTIRAGLPILSEDNWEEVIRVPDYLDADFALRIVGDSMSWVGIHEGDLALMEQTSVASHGSIVAAGIDDGEWRAALKFFVQDNTGFKLRSANPEYEDMSFTAQHRIIGKLIRVIKETPSLHDYKNMVISKDILDQDWQDTIMRASKIGLDGKQVQNMLELFASVVKKVN
ncbi:SOS response transcriptional repressor, RecA-mediated autopeptidase [Desulfitobacterium dehalogenans ATCC 51507]|uniref:SOS response transcriptional repressor, RecA-mediated autopeptidase n=1 Tax=Desulfitobacterium dehalogenans (strain ATCC 51507 / DSM 9161 / JW/IU-DC1) TaxID=756499 RepID=I4AC22_DESDJ|nr:LexA family transcriptional regulator [Desulfitobacterium dehalogenans]AFM01507.1 SOS response transcriptional repressor, RecA-mediated autopeptidase [Desulfitobacterium dehalogenans ATCC 51507]